MTLINIKSILIKNRIALYLIKKIRNRTRNTFKINKDLFRNKIGIEVGGPSNIFKKSGPIPIYSILKSLDNINFNDNNFWSSIKEGNNFTIEGEINGKQIITDGTDLSKINSEQYDLLLSSHVIEHIANPIKALFEWNRVIKKNGFLIIIAPDKRYTYDRKRPLTDLNHIIEDYNKNITENDETHYQEVLDLHDLTNDGTVNSYEEHAQRTLNNKNTRIVHHHTFDIELLKNLLQFSNFKIIASDIFRPYHLFVIAQKK